VRLAVLGAVAALLLTAGWLVGFSSVLDTRQVTVTGVHLLTADSVRKAAAAPLGEPLLRQDTEAIAARVRALRPVESVSVERRWPHTLAVAVRERQPVLVIPSPEGFVLVDRTGAQFATLVTAPSGVPRAEIDLADQPLVSEVAGVAEGLTPALAKRVTKIDGRSGDSIRLVVDGRVEVRWGSADQTPLKASIVTALLKRKPKTIDVTAPHSPAIR
jgi:cell division protein FtsQ